jgi:hypothetical protein
MKTDGGSGCVGSFGVVKPLFLTRLCTGCCHMSIRLLLRTAAAIVESTCGVGSCAAKLTMLFLCNTAFALLLPCSAGSCFAAGHQLG